MGKNIYFEILKTLLKSEAAFCDEQGALVKEKVIEEANRYNPSLIELLLGNKETKEEFFVKAADTYIFKIERFMNILKNKAFLPDSYTSFQNKIGFNISKELNSFICLDFPYKDCYLEGGQTKEEGRRKEVFFNSILAKDQINKLLEPKAFVNAKRITAKHEKPLENFSTDERGFDLSDNLLIKGNNLLALHSLKKRFAGKVKLIYIDPPYNTGNDSFKYNDSFNHSSWLVFMKNRLEIARELLREDGVIFVQCDDNEQAYLKVLMDEIFGRENFVGALPRITKKAGKSTNLISKNHDIILIYYKSEISFNRLEMNTDDYSNIDEFYDNRGGYKLNQTLDYNSLQYNKTMDYEIEINNEKFYPGNKELFEERLNGKYDKIDWVWRWSKQKLQFGLENGFVKIKNGRIYTKTYANATISKDENGYFVDIIAREKNISSLDLVLDNKFSNDNSTKHISILFDNKNIFSYSKPESLFERILNIATQEGDIVLDFFAGSGTTAAAAHKMGRQWIAIEQMDYIDTITKERLKKVLEGEQGGISKSVNWQGGGDFVYLELASYNQAYIDMLGKAQNTDELLSVYEEIKKNAFVHYLFDFKDFENHMLDFKNLSLDEQKQYLCGILEMNMLYIPLSSLEDGDFSGVISKHDIAVNKKFYKDTYGETE